MDGRGTNLRAVISFLACGVITLALAACGGGGAKTVTQVETQAAGAPLTKAEYIAKADAVCAANRPQRDQIKSEIQSAVASGVNSVSDANRLANLANQAADYVDRLLSQLQALPSPSGDEQILSELYSAVSAQGTDIRHLSDAITSLDRAQITSFAAAAKSDEERARGIAVGYGFKVCGQG